MSSSRSIRLIRLSPLALALAAACGPQEAPRADGASGRARDSVAAAVDPAQESCAPEGTIPLGVRPGAPYHVRVHEREAGVVDSLVVFRGCERVQALVPEENVVPPERTGLARVSTVDLDFDGHGDLAFLSMLGMANSTSEYWRFDPAARRFQPLGTYDTFELDRVHRELVTRSRGGHAGLLWTAGRYRFVRGKLTQVREEAQDWSDEAQAYVHTVRLLRGDTLAEVRRDTLTRAEAERRASEQ